MRQLFLILGFGYCCLAAAKGNYQVDLILFAQPDVVPSQLGLETIFLPKAPQAISLDENSGKSHLNYALLPASSSSLKNYSYLLNRKAYQILGHYSWRQPEKNQSAVFLPLQEHHGWQLQGSIQVKKNHYYHFNTDLYIIAPSRPQAAFILSHQQRLKESTVYYLDDERIGLLVKIHTV